MVGLIACAALVAACTSTTSGSPGGPGQGGSAAKPGVEVSVSPDEAGAVTPITPIVVKATGGTLSAVTVTNPTSGTKVKGGYSDDKTSWTSSEPLGYATAYQVAVDAVDRTGGTVQRTATVHTLTPKAQAYPSFIPPPSVTDVGVGQPLVVKFDQDIADKAAAEKALVVTATPAQAGGWYWLSKREVHYRPQVYWQAGTTIKLHAGVYGINLGGDVYGQTDRDLTVKVHDSWVAKADGATQQMQILHDGALVNTMPISMGKEETPTHVGIHVISDKQQKYTMDSCTYGLCPPDPKAYRTDEYFAERISNDGEFVHENPNSVAAQGSSNVSHGCINLNNANARWFFDHFGLGDVVEVVNSGGSPLPLWDTYGDWSLSWADWQAGSALR
ncbi:MAG TPA: Ig-like domain-containing protein [Pseudonocardiaceae bacterium]|jgi:lipoprotein-anchoring transpeptidase ErfK/SrfK